MTTRAAAIALVLVLAGCGSGKTTAPPVAKPPRIPHALAQAWVAQANAVAQALAESDGCTAVAHATALRSEVSSNETRVPRRLRSQLLATVNALPGRITCNPAPPPPSPPAHPHPHPHPPKPPKHHGPRHHDH
jgi:forkhead box protein L